MRPLEVPPPRRRLNLWICVRLWRDAMIVHTRTPCRRPQLVLEQLCSHG